MKLCSQCCFLFGKVVRRMSTNYESAIQKLNSLQSNKDTIKQIRNDIKTRQKCNNLSDMKSYLLRVGITLANLDELSVVHVAGTKGKGSTSAMCESVIRAHGLRTGLYTSPHLVAVRERIQLSGRALDRATFAGHLHDVFDKLADSQAFEGDMPKYFAFLTVLAFYVFIVEKVDVAVIEVGIGGVVDYTNVLRKVPVVGITSLGFDHTSILGNTIEEIAAAKAGIMKPGCEAYTVSQQPAAMEVLKRVADTVKCPLRIVPNFQSYAFPQGHKPQLQVDLEAYQSNASLAIQLAHAWLRLANRRDMLIQALNTRNAVKKQTATGKVRQNGFTDIEPLNVNEYSKQSYKSKDAIITILPKETLRGLGACKWPGRYHVIKSDYATFYLDGAHTRESMEICAEWFQSNNRNAEKHLIFSATGDRDKEVLLKPLRDIDFKAVYFVIPTAYKKLNKKHDNYTTVEQEDLIASCRNHAEIWTRGNYAASSITVLECVSDAFICIKKNSDYKPSVLVSGSLYLVGAALSILDPSIKD